LFIIFTNINNNIYMDKFNLSDRLEKEKLCISCIYRIYNKDSGKSYIGSTNNLGRRIKKHRDELGTNVHKNLHLQRSYNKYGRDSFLVFIEEIVDNDLLTRE
jgi:group I intron endonuclease